MSDLDECGFGYYIRDERQDVNVRCGEPVTTLLIVDMQDGTGDFPVGLCEGHKRRMEERGAISPE